MLIKDNKKFYIIGTTRDITGIGAILIGYIGHALYAINNQMIPVIDLKHYKNQYFKDGRTYKDNTWEYFFEQPCGYTIEDIDENSDIVISENIRLPQYHCSFVSSMLPISSSTKIDKKILKLKSDYQSLIKFNAITQEYINNTYQKVIGNKKNILGVLCRGTDYSKRRSYGEQIQPSVSRVIKKIDHFLKKHPEIEYIYLATEDDSIFQTFKNKFKDKLLDNNQYRYTYSKKKFICDIKVDRPNHNYQLALEYLSSLHILSNCKYFIGGKCTGTMLAYIMQNCWQDLYIWNLGRYGKSLREKIFSTNIQCDNSKDYKIINLLGFKLKFSKR